MTNQSSGRGFESRSDYHFFECIELERLILLSGIISLVGRAGQKSSLIILLIDIFSHP